MTAKEYDVYLCHNNSDKTVLKKIYAQLQARNLKPWLDEKQKGPDIENIGAAAVFVGKSGVGPWQDQELDARLREFVKRKCPVIPVILPEARGTPQLPLYLSSMRWVDLRKEKTGSLDGLLSSVREDFSADDLSQIKEDARMKQGSQFKHNFPYRSAEHFVGRERELETLHELLQAGEPTAILSSQSGLNGVGKTELALQYAWKYQADYPLGVCWLDGQAGEPGIEFSDYEAQYWNIVAPEELTPEGRLDYIRRHLPEGSALVILHDYPGAFPEFLRRLPDSYRLLVTAREHPGADFRTISLEVLDSGAALVLLTELIADSNRIDSQREEAAKLCEWLGSLPLALELVGNYLRHHPQLSFAQMREQLEARSKEHGSLTLKEGNGLRSIQHKGVWAALDLSREALSVREEELALLLGQLGGAPVPLGLIEAITARFKGSQGQTESWDAASSQLSQLYLLERPDEGHFHLHPLVREYFQMLLEQLAPERGDSIRRAVAFELAREAEAISHGVTLKQAEARADLVVHWEWACESLADVLDEKDLYRPFEALTLYYQLYNRTELAMREKALGPEHPDTAASLNSLAALHYLMDNYDAAFLLYERALAIREEALGTEHPDTATSLNNLAILYDSQGKFAAALPLYERALAINEKVLGVDHPDTAMSLNNLAALHESQKHFASALPLYECALAIREKVLGAEHPSTATSLNNLAGLHYSLGNFDVALPLHEQALAISEKALGVDHPNTITIRKNLEFHQEQKRVGG